MASVAPAGMECPNAWRNLPIAFHAERQPENSRSSAPAMALWLEVPRNAAQMVAVFSTPSSVAAIEFQVARGVELIIRLRPVRLRLGARGSTGDRRVTADRKRRRAHTPTPIFVMSAAGACSLSGLGVALAVVAKFRPG